MGHITLPENALVAPQAKPEEHQEANVNLTDCRSPLARWLDGSADFGAVEEFVTAAPQPQQQPQPQQMPWVLMVPVMVENQQPMVGQSSGWEQAWYNSYPESASGSADSDCGYAESYTTAYTASTQSASAARRARRRRAAERAQWAAGEADTFSAYASGSRGVQPSRCADLIARLQGGSDDVAAAISEIRGSVRRLTFEADGCRVVQKALEVADQSAAAELASELHGCVRRAIASPHGNYVIQKVIESLPTAQSAFIVKELLGAGAEIACHRFGCRIMCRLLEHSGTDALTVSLVDEILELAGELCRHSFGHHVIEAILEHAPEEQKHKVALTLYNELLHNAMDRHGTYVIESALRNCSQDDRRSIVATFQSNEESVLFLAEHQYGYHVVKALLKHSDQTASIRNFIMSASARLAADMYGSRIIDSLATGAAKL